MPYMSMRWLGGTLTNFRTVKQSVGRLKELEAAETDGTFEKMVKHEVLGLRRELLGEDPDVTAALEPARSVGDRKRTSVSSARVARRLPVSVAWAPLAFSATLNAPIPERAQFGVFRM